MQQDQDRVGDVLAPNNHPLIESAQWEIGDFRDATWKDLTVRTTKRRCLSRMFHDAFCFLPVDLVFFPSVSFAQHCVCHANCLRNRHMPKPNNPPLRTAMASAWPQRTSRPAPFSRIPFAISMK